jgi:hypothetical protein
MRTLESSPSHNLESVIGYLRPALDHMRRRDMPFESYLLEMLILSLSERTLSAAHDPAPASRLAAAE